MDEPLWETQALSATSTNIFPGPSFGEATTAAVAPAEEEALDTCVIHIPGGNVSLRPCKARDEANQALVKKRLNESALKRVAVKPNSTATAEKCWAKTCQLDAKSRSSGECKFKKLRISVFTA